MFAILQKLEKTGAMSTGVLLGVIDGLPDLSLRGFETVQVEKTMMVEGRLLPDPHATEICSLLFSGEVGLAAGANGLALPIFFGGPSVDPGGLRASQVDIARALTMAFERNVDIVNISAGQLSSTAEAGRHLENALDLCSRKNMLVVAAAGNDGCACLHVPAAVETVLAVGAMDNSGMPLKESNYGSDYGRNGLLAPGKDIPVCTVGGKRTTKTGTSYATAIVSGVAARLLAVSRRSGYPYEPSQIGALLIESSDPCDEVSDGDCARVLAGKLNVAAAIELLHQRGRAKNGEALRPLAATSKGRGTVTTDNVIQSTSEFSGISAAETVGIGQSACACGCDDSDSGGEAAEDVVASAASPAPREVQPSGDSVNQSVSSTPVEAPAVAPASENMATVRQQAAGEQSPQLVYAIGALWFDFGNEPRYDAIVQQMGSAEAANNPIQLLGFLSENLPFASGITFILMQDQIPIYAIAPAGPFATDIYRDLIDTMRTSMDPTGDLQRVALPGIVHGSTRLMNGMVLPVLYPDIRGMVAWQAQELATAAKVAIGDDGLDDDSIFNFLVRIYDELRNLGISSEDRATNFAATNAYQAASAFADGARRKLELYRLLVSRSPICRPDSDCWDVQLVMFDPENERRAGRFYRFTIDVSEVLPVTVGPMRTWSAPLGSL